MGRGVVLVDRDRETERDRDPERDRDAQRDTETDGLADIARWKLKMIITEYGLVILGPCR